MKIGGAVLAYGMSEFKFADTAGIPVSEAKRIISMYFKTFPEIAKFFRYLEMYGIWRGYITTFQPFRRIRFFPGIRTDDKKYLASVGRKSRNTPIQGCGADMMKVAMVELRKWLKANPEYGVRPVMTVHDQLDTLCPREKAEEWAGILKSIMEDAAKQFFPGGELKAEPNISEKWEK